MVLCNVMSEHSRDDALECSSVKDALRSSSNRTRVAVNIVVLLVFGSETSLTSQKQVPKQCVMLVFTSTLTRAVMVLLCCD